jgi:glycosyltransferase involved in cell wall biosynthesis
MLDSLRIFINSLPIFIKKVDTLIKVKLIRKMIGYPVLYNVNNSSELTHKKRALLIYLVTPFLLKDNAPIFLNHQNFKQCKQIAAILGDFGFIVDIADYQDRRFKHDRNYDLIISHRVNFNVADTWGKNAIKIYLSAGLNHITSNRNVLRRYANFRKRRQIPIKLRDIYEEEMPYVKAANGIIGFGNDFAMNTWRIIFKGPIFPFYNYAFVTENQLKARSKDFSVARKNYFFFASGSQIRKGLDLLLEVFPKHPDLHLFICSSFKKETDFCRCYFTELYKTANIHPIGWVRVGSPNYFYLVGKCAFVILPSCSEGHPGSVVQCMAEGLIPIVTKEAGIDTDDFGITLIDDSLGEIEQTIVNLSEKPIDWLIKHSMRTKEIAEIFFSEEAFLQRWRDITRLILDMGGKSNRDS